MASSSSAKGGVAIQPPQQQPVGGGSTVVAAASTVTQQEGKTADAMWAELTENCVQFTFPPTQLGSHNVKLPWEVHATVPHQRSFHWVTVYAKYGPGTRIPCGPNSSGSFVVKLKGGAGRSAAPAANSISKASSSSSASATSTTATLLQPHEEKQLWQEEERSFLCETYNGGDGVTAPVGCSGRTCTRQPNEVHKTFSAASECETLLHTTMALGNTGATVHRRSESLGNTFTASTASASTSFIQQGQGGGETTATSSTRRSTSSTAGVGVVQRPAAARSLVAPNTFATALSDHVVGELMRHRTPAFEAACSITRDELVAFLSACAAASAYPKAEKDGAPMRLSTVFDAMSSCLLHERERRICALKSTVPLLPSIRADPRVCNRQAALFLSKSHPKTRDIRKLDTPKDVIAALHRFASQITDMPTAQSDGSCTRKPSAAEITNNVKCLRQDHVADGTKPGWNGTCCLAKSQGTRNPVVVATMAKPVENVAVDPADC